MPKTLRINLGHSGDIHPKPTIRPGTVLYGEVCYNPQARVTLTSVTVNLLGKLVVKAPKNRREVTQLFSVQHPIRRKEEDPIALEVKEHKFAFHFVVPWTTEYDRTNTLKPDPNGRFTETPHRVPPSKSKGDAQVLYSISAIVRTKEVASGVRYNPLGDSAIGTELEDVRCIVELPEVPLSSDTTVRERLARPVAKQGIFRRSSVVDNEAQGSSRFVSIYAPGILVLGEKHELNASAESSDYDACLLAEKQWRLAIKSVELVATTHRRLKDGSEFDEEETFTLSKPSVPQTLPLDPRSNLTFDVTASRTGPIGPSFRSYAISQVHALRVNVLSYIGDSKSSTQEDRWITLPVEVIQRGDSLSRHGSVAPQDINGQMIEPPPYEDSPAYY